jgi:hypothetical protein
MVLSGRFVDRFCRGSLGVGVLGNRVVTLLFRLAGEVSAIIVVFNWLIIYALIIIVLLLPQHSVICSRLEIGALESLFWWSIFVEEYGFVVERREKWSRWPRNFKV